MFRLLLLLAGLASMPCRAEFRDPTQPAYPLPSATADDTVSDIPLVLTAIWISPHSRRATINGISARQGQTIVIEQTPALKPVPATPETGATTGDKSNKAKEYVKENAESPLGHTTAPVHASRPLEQSAETTESIPARSNMIKIISIRKNSVIITQNGELKALQLVQRPYKTINSKYTQK